MKLDEGGSAQAHIKTMMEVFEGLSVVGDLISDEDRVVHLLASLPDSYGMLVTAYRNGLSKLSEERNTKERVRSGIVARRKDNALIANRGTRYQSIKKVFFHCGKPGHFKRSCPLLGSSNQDGKKPSRTEQANNAELETESSDSENDAVLQVTGSYTQAQRVTCVMIRITIKMLKKPSLITLGDGRALIAIGL